ncbi:MAG: cysteine methyltransferase, partial [Acidobacteria bacterium]
MPFKKDSFFQQVYRVVRQIPPGKVLTYGQIATLVGAPYLARQVGWAMHGCPPWLPWQRVVGAG